MFNPGSNFPSVSITGSRCALNCKHCNRLYLKHMIAAEDPDTLLKVAADIKVRGGTGFLLSGGCGPDGRMDFAPFLDAMRRITDELELKINVHTGVVNIQDAAALVAAGMHTASIDVVGDDRVIEEVYGSTHKVDDIRSSLNALRTAGARLVPHICLGLDFGLSTGVEEAMEMAVECHPSAVVVISLIPTRGTPMENVDPPGAREVGRTIRSLKQRLDVPVYLGCMRDRKYRENERAALSAGVDGIVNPARETVDMALGMGLDIRKLNACCGIF